MYLEARSDDHLNILLSLLMLFDPESVDFLEDKSKVERIHSTFVRMLAHYLDSATGGDRDEADHRFRTGMAMVAKIKRMQRIQEERGRWFTPQKLLAPSQEKENK